MGNGRTKVEATGRDVFPKTHQPALIGREFELALIVEQLKRARSGFASGVLLRGEGGVGKSRLLDEVLDRGRRMGSIALLGRADEFDRGVPFAVFRDAFNRANPELLNQTQREAFESLRDDLDRDFDSNTTSSNDGEASTSARRILTRVAHLLDELGQKHPPLLVLEDMHLADPASTALAGLLARHLTGRPFFLAASIRTGHHPSASMLEQLFDRLHAEGSATTIDLERLDRAEIHAFTASILDGEPSSRLIDLIFDQSRGNPFFASECIAELAHSSELIAQAGQIRLVSNRVFDRLGVSTALLHRVFQQFGEEAKIARAVSVFGRFQLRHLPIVEQITGQTPQQVTTGFDRLVAESLLISGPSGYEFTHPILRNTIYDDIGPAERKRMHGIVASTITQEIERGERSSRGVDRFELATHLSGAADRPDLTAGTAALEAAKVAYRTAPLVSADWAARALDFLPTESSVRHDAEVLLARSLFSGSRPRSASDAALTVLHQLQGAERSRMASIAVNGFYMAGEIEEALKLVENELEIGSSRCPLLAMRVHLLAQLGRVDEALDGIGLAMESVDGGDVAQVIALSHLLHVGDLLGDRDVIGKVIQRLDGLETPLGTRTRFSIDAVRAVDCLLSLRYPGSLDEGERRLANLRDAYGSSAEPSLGGQFEAATVQAHWLRGRWDEAHTAAQNASFDLARSETTILISAIRSVEVFINVERGMQQDALELEPALVSPIRALDGTVMLARVRIRRMVDDEAGATALLTHWFQHSAQHAPRRINAQLAEELVELEEHNGHVRSATILAGLVDHMNNNSSPMERLVVNRMCAAVHRDVGPLQIALQIAQEEGFAVEAARCQLMLGEFGEQPADHLTAAFETFDQVGATVRRGRAAAALRSIEQPVPKSSSAATTQLTQTETDIVRLLQQSMTNRQIAASLSYSPKTIEVYLSRIYAKTGCANRLALVRAADIGEISLT